MYSLVSFEMTSNIHLRDEEKSESERERAFWGWSGESLCMPVTTANQINSNPCI